MRRQVEPRWAQPLSAESANQQLTHHLYAKWTKSKCCKPLRSHCSLPLQTWWIQGKRSSVGREHMFYKTVQTRFFFKGISLSIIYMCVWMCCSFGPTSSTPNNFTLPCKNHCCIGDSLEQITVVSVTILFAVRILISRNLGSASETGS